MGEIFGPALLVGSIVAACLLALLPFIAGVTVLDHMGKRMEAGWKSRVEAGDQQMDALARSLASVEQRMKSLETILDDEAPGWRKRHEREMEKG